MVNEKLEIGKRIKIIRKNLGLSQREFAERINMKTQYLSNVENGISGLTIEKVKQICNVTNVSTDYIIFGIDSLPLNTFKKAFSEYTDEDINKSFRLLNDLVLLFKN